MFRAIFELLLSIIVIMAARAILTSVLKGFAKASSDTYQKAAGPEPQAQARSAGQSNTTTASDAGGRDLHKDPVCGTYVVESTAYRRQSAGQTFYYCSEACKEKHSLVAR